MLPPCAAAPRSAMCVSIACEKCCNWTRVRREGARWRKQNQVAADKSKKGRAREQREENKQTRRDSSKNRINAKGAGSKTRRKAAERWEAARDDDDGGGGARGESSGLSKWVATDAPRRRPRVYQVCMSAWQTDDAPARVKQISKERNPGTAVMM